MSNFNSKKNIFLLVFFLCSMFVIPKLVEAKVDVVGDTKGYLNDNDKASGYIVDEAYFTLFNANPSNPQLTDEEIDALKVKLKADLVPFADNITKYNVYRENSSNVSTFVYKEKPGKDVNIAYATKRRDNGTGGNFYTVLKPTVKESVEANEQLNIIDKAQGRPEGTTINDKNVLWNARAAEESLQQKVDETTKKADEARQELENVRSNGGTPQQIAVAQALVDAAEFQETGALNNRGVNQKIITEKERQAASYNQPVSEPDCGVTNFWSPNCMLWGVAILTNVIFKLASFAAYLVGTLFDYSLELSVNSAEFLKKLGVVEITWSFIRDILNMTFIFILLFTAVQILIGNDAKYNARKILTNVVIFAILMNFSLFAAKLMVDGSNIVSLKIYEVMKSSSANKESSISLRVMNTVGLTGLYNVSEIFTPKTLQAEGTCANNPTSLITVSILGTIFLIVLILALGLAAILFLIRLVNIIFLFIRSPLWVWGYVIPGNERMNQISRKWWSEMQHVLLFPILYLFQILIAIIVFDKLATIQKDGGSLLSLICSPPVGASGLGSSISLVAVFCIVIMFLMRAISYGVKHVGDGGDGAIGNKLGTGVANKFAGWQTKMTSGLAKKAGAATLGASVGAIKVPLRAVTGLGYGARSASRGNGFWKGAGDGFSNPGANLKETAADALRNSALGLRGVPIVGSALARKAVALQAQTTKERKEIDNKIIKGSKEDEENLIKMAAEKYKPDTQEQWEKKNGAIGVDAAKADKYKEYVEKQIEKRAKVSFGNKDIIHKENKDGTKHLTAIMDKALVREEIRDAGGNITGIKFKLDNKEVAKGLGDVSKYHTTGAGATKINKKGLWKPYRTQKAEAKAKAAEAAFKAEEGKYQNDQNEKDSEAMIKKIKEKLALLPEDKTIDEMIKDPTSPGLDKKAGKESREFNTARRNLEDAEHSYSGNIPSDIRRDLEEKVYDAGEKVKEVREKVNKDLIKKNEDLAKKAAAAEKAKEK